MIVVLFGQPSSGKTTLANEIKKHKNFVHIDGDELRNIFYDYDYSREGRIKNLNRASDIAHYLSQTDNVILSLVYPYKEARDYLNSLNNNVKWFCLCTSQDRGKEKFKVSDFEYNNDCLFIDTDNTIEECLFSILQHI